MFDRRFISVDICLARSRSLKCSVPLGCADHLLIEKVHRALLVLLRFQSVRLRFRESRFCLGERFFKGPRINLKKEIALFDHGAFLIILRNDVTGHARGDRGIHQTVECGHAFFYRRHILRLHSRDQNFRRSWGNVALLTRTSQRQ